MGTCLKSLYFQSSKWKKLVERAQRTRKEKKVNQLVTIESRNPPIIIWSFGFIFNLYKSDKTSNSICISKIGALRFILDTHIRIGGLLVVYQFLAILIYVL